MLGLLIYDNLTNIQQLQLDQIKMMLVYPVNVSMIYPFTTDGVPQVILRDWNEVYNCILWVLFWRLQMWSRPRQLPLGQAFFLLGCSTLLGNDILYQTRGHLLQENLCSTANCPDNPMSARKKVHDHTGNIIIIIIAITSIRDLTHPNRNASTFILIYLAFILDTCVENYSLQYCRFPSLHWMQDLLDVSFMNKRLVWLKPSISITWFIASTFYSDVICWNKYDTFTLPFTNMYKPW